MRRNLCRIKNSAVQNTPSSSGNVTNKFFEGTELTQCENIKYELSDPLDQQDAILESEKNESNLPPNKPSSAENLRNSFSEETIMTKSDFSEYERNEPNYEATIIESEKNTDFFEFEYINGFRSNSTLVYTKDEKQIYKKHNIYNKGTRYACYNKKCRASVFIDEYERCRKLNKLHSHNHSTQELLKDKMLLSRNIKEACKNVPSEICSTRDIFDEECRKASDCAHLVQFRKMRRNLYRIKTSVPPKNLLSPEDFKNTFSEEKFMRKYGFSKSEPGEPFYQGTIIEPKYSFAIFMSPTIKKLILENSHIKRNFYLDGTFGVVPSPIFKHLIIIHIEYLEYIYPFLFVLMTSKSQEAYVHMLQYINTNLMVLNPLSIVTDYEESLINALKSAFPSAELSGSWFHYCQAIRQNARETPNFRAALTKSNALRRLMKKLMALPLLKPDMIHMAFGLLQTEVDKIPMASLYSTISSDFVEYVKKRWIEKEGPENISVHDASIKTTCALEGYHSHLTAKLSNNGNFFKFLNILLEDDVKKIVMLKMELHGTVEGDDTIIPCFYKKRSNLIRKLVASAEKGEISLIDFLDKIANNLNNLLEDINTEHFPETENSKNEIKNSEKGIENSENGRGDKAHPMPCIFCTDEEKSVLLLPCDHLEFCNKCIEAISEKAKAQECTYCKAIVSHTSKVFI